MVVITPVARGLRRVAVVLGVLAIVAVVASMKFTATGRDLLFTATLAFIALGFPAVLAMTLSLWLEHHQESDVAPTDPALATGAGGSRAPFMGPQASYAVAVLCVGVAWGIRHVLDSFLLAYLPFPTFFLAVAFAGWLGGFGPAVLATAISAVIARYFYMSPLHELTMDSVLTAVSISMFVLVSLALAAVTSMLHTALRRIAQLTSASKPDAQTPGTNPANTARQHARDEG